MLLPVFAMGGKSIAKKVEQLKKSLNGRAPTAEELAAATGLTLESVKSVFSAELSPEDFPDPARPASAKIPEPKKASRKRKNADALPETLPEPEKVPRRRKVKEVKEPAAAVAGPSAPACSDMDVPVFPFPESAGALKDQTPSNMLWSNWLLSVDAGPIKSGEDRALFPVVSFGIVRGPCLDSFARSLETVEYGQRLLKGQAPSSQSLLQESPTP